MKINTKVLEEDIELDILMRLQAKRIGHFWKVEYPLRKIGKMYLKSNHPYVLRGVSDINGVSKSIFYAFEVKLPKEKAKIKRNFSFYRQCLKDKNKERKRVAHQILYIESIVRNGGVGAFVSSWADVQKVLSIGSPGKMYI